MSKLKLYSTCSYQISRGEYVRGGYPGVSLCIKNPDSKNKCFLFQVLDAAKRLHISILTQELWHCALYCVHKIDKKYELKRRWKNEGQDNNHYTISISIARPQYSNTKGGKCIE